VRFVHRDIKPANIFINSETDEVILNDWSSSVPLTYTAIPFHGTFGFYDERDISVRDSVRFHTPTPQNHLMALVRSAYLMLFHVSAPTYDINDIDQWWNYLLREGTI
jgi:serine/threonine protein kinase